jgi:hypothetical protein
MEQQNIFIKSLLNPDYKGNAATINIKEMEHLKKVVEYETTNLTYKISSQDKFIKTSQNLIHSIQIIKQKIIENENELVTIGIEFNALSVFRNKQNSEKLLLLVERANALQMNLSAHFNLTIFEFLTIVLSYFDYRNLKCYPWGQISFLHRSNVRMTNHLY